jgi:aminopeptidase N
MINSFARGTHRSVWLLCGALLISALIISNAARGDEPYARSRDYDLQNVRTHLWFDLGQRMIHGEVNESVSALRDKISQLKFDSVDLTVEDVTIDGTAAKYSTTADELIVSLDHPAKRGEVHQVFIRYEGKPKKGLYFVLPDKNYPNQPKEIWTQGEAEDTRYYIPTYDFPNARPTSEMLLTVPATWLTVSNGQLAGVKEEGDGTKTWDWKQSAPLSTYLITAVAGDFVEKQDSWRGIPLRYVVPRGEEDRIDATFARTKQMLDLFSDTLAVPYPWAQYAQVAVDEFGGGMENTSATTLTASELVNPTLAAESLDGSDLLISHELSHQWFGDLITCKDWSDLWLNEGFATYFEHFWTERHYGADAAAYEFWRDQQEWFSNRRLFVAPIVNREAQDPFEFEGNIYNKGSWVLKMLREKLGDDDFFRALHNYLETNRGANVVTSDFPKAIEQATSVNVDMFFQQWIYGAGAPEFDVSYTYDEAAHQVKLEVKQTQKVEGAVGLFDVPVDVEIATSNGRATHSIEVTKADETFPFTADSNPLAVIFDKGDKILKLVNFKREAAALIYQLKNGETVPDRAEAAAALGEINDNSSAVPALGDAALHDPFWGIRVEALRSLGRIGGPDAEKSVLAALDNEKPWVRDVAVEELGEFNNDPTLAPKLTSIAESDNAFRVRAAALQSLATIKAPNAFEKLIAAIKSDSPDDTLRIAGLRGLGVLGDDKAVPKLLEWSAPGKPRPDRKAAIAAVAGLDKKNKAITKTLISCLDDSSSGMKFAAVIALVRRGDPDAIDPLEKFVKNNDLGIGMGSLVKSEISALKAQTNQEKAGGANTAGASQAAESNKPAAGAQDSTAEALKNLERQMEEVNQRLAKIEAQLAKRKK